MKLSKKLVGSILVCFVPAVFGSAFTAPNIAGWYNTLTKPALTPPNWVFAPVWTLLYLMMGYSLFLVLETKPGQQRQKALRFFFAQLLLNGMWSGVFFGSHQLLPAFLTIFALWLALFKTIRLFSELDKTAGRLLVPYLAWTSFAAYLNLAVFLLN